MRQLRFIFIAILTSLFVINTVFWRKAIAVLLSGIYKVNKFMRRIRFWLLGIVSFIIAIVATVFVSGSSLNRLLLAASCTIFSFNSTFCIPNLGWNPIVRCHLSPLTQTSEGHRGITLKATSRIWLFKDASGKDFNFTGEASKEIERANRRVDLTEDYLEVESISDEIWKKVQCPPLLRLLPTCVVVNTSSDPRVWRAIIDRSFDKDTSIIFSYSFYVPGFHFDRETFIDGSRWLKLRKDDMLKELRPIKNASDEDAKLRGKQARKYLGQALHSLQDFYAHSNWVELGKTKFNEDLGREVICDGKGDEHTPPCSKPADLEKNVSGEPTAVLKDVCSTVGHNNLPCHKEYDPGTLDPTLKKLTSGYFMGLTDCTAPVGKTRHGTLGCSGLSKDNSEHNGFAPGGYKKAFDFAVDASVDYINQIVRTLEDEGNFEAIKALMGMPANLSSAPTSNGSQYEFRLVAKDGDAATDFGSEWKIELADLGIGATDESWKFILLCLCE